VSFVAVVTHPQRAAMGELLAYQQHGFSVLDADGEGCAATHVRALRELAGRTNARWLVVLEDDAVPVAGFCTHAGDALEHACGVLVSFYLGTGNNPGVQNVVRAAVRAADKGDCSWIRADCLMSTVGYAIHRSVVDDLLGFVPHYRAELPVAITRWAQMTGNTVDYTWPSLVDHRDGWSTIAQAEIVGRVAHRCRARASWNADVVALGRVPGWSAA
jgi:hypothetical protein